MDDGLDDGRDQRVQRRKRLLAVERLCPKRFRAGPGLADHLHDLANRASRTGTLQNIDHTEERPEEPLKNRTILLTEQMIRFVFDRRRPNSVPYFPDALRCRFGTQPHAGMCENIGIPTDELLTLRTGLVAGDLKELAGR
ncbi:hypothetical protein GCM10023075_22350 [Streptosporangium album]